MTTAPAILPDARTRWLAARRELITASDVAAIIGEDPRRGPLAVYCDKVGAAEQDETVPMRRGRRFERAIADEYADQTGRLNLTVPEYEIVRHPNLFWLGATLDAKVLATKAKPDPFGTWDFGPGGESRSRAPLQVKMAIGSAREWKDEPPLGYVVQVQVEMACAGSMWGALAALVGPGPLATFDLERDDAFFAALVPLLERFRWHVEKRIPPEADGKPGTSEAIRKLWPTANGVTVPLGAEDGAVMDDLESARARVAAAKQTERELLNQLHARMAGAQWGALPDGSFVRRTPVERDSYEVAESKYVTLSRWRPRIRR